MSPACQGLDTHETLMNPGNYFQEGFREQPARAVPAPGEAGGRRPRTRRTRPLAAAEQPPRNLSEPVAREPGPRRGETERPRSTVAVPPDHPVRAPSGGYRAVVGIPPGQVDRHALAQRRRDPRRHHPCETRPACSRPASTCRRLQRTRRLSVSGHDRAQHCKAPHRHPSLPATPVAAARANSPARPPLTANPTLCGKPRTGQTPIA